MYVRPTFRRRKIAAAVASVIALTVTHQAMAALVTTSSINGQVTVGENTSVSYSQGPSTGYISDSASDTFAPVDSAFAASWVNTNNAFAASASGQGFFEADARLVRQFVVTNDLGVAAQGVIDFYVYGGILQALAQPESIELGGSGTAAYELDIEIGGMTLFTSSANVGSSGVFNQNGTALMGASFDGMLNAYTWSATQLSFNLGVLAPGESIAIDYRLVTTATGDYGQFTTVTSGGCDGYGYGGNGYGYGGEIGCCVDELLLEGPTECVTTQPGGYSFAFLGDPAELMLEQETATLPGGARTLLTLTPVSVPAPAGLLALVGVAGALAFRRRRRAQ